VRVLIVGCGYVGTATGAALVDRGHTVDGMNRTMDASDSLAARGINPIQGDITRLDDLERLDFPYDWVINCVSSSRGATDVYRQVYFEGTRNLLAAMRDQSPKKYLFTSSTCVYGQTDGSVVDEDSATEPSSETARCVLETERLLVDAFEQEGFPAIRLRLSGIYGPGRGHLFQKFVQGTAEIQTNSRRFINMIHLDDIAASVCAVLEKGEPGMVYNVTDDEPVSPRDFFEWLSAMSGRPLPPEASEERATNRKRALTLKRVSNRRLREELGVDLKYPTFREGYTPELRREGLLVASTSRDL